jgi:hypothetical protein
MNLYFNTRRLGLAHLVYAWGTGELANAAVQTTRPSQGKH